MKKTVIVSFLLFPLLSPCLHAQKSGGIETGECVEGDSGCKKDQAVFDPLQTFSSKISEFFASNIYNQGEEKSEESSDPFPPLTEGEEYTPFKEAFDKVGTFFSDFGLSLKDKSFKDNKKFDEVMSNVISATSTTSRSMEEVFDLFVRFFKESVENWSTQFKHVSFEQFHPFSIWYYIELMDEVKNPSWKRRKHRNHKQVPINSVVELHNALYLSQLSYAGSLPVVKEGVRDFMNNTFELVYADIEGLPGEPANFIIVHKESSSGNTKYIMTPLGFEIPMDIPLEVILVVRGTKEFGDMLSDTLLDAASFNDGKAHKGILKAGHWLAEEHIERLRILLEGSKRKKLKLKLIGHSLGAGTAAIAAMLFNKHDWIEASSIGFGCPAVLDLVQSEAVKDYIVTVVTDSDVVPRMSGAALANIALDVMSYDWTNKALEDLELTLSWLQLPSKESIINFANGTMEKFQRPFFSQVSKERIKQILYPPGNCIHIFRDGVSFTATYTPCSFFDSIDFSRSMVDDHLIPTGYHRAFLELLRDNRKDYGADFQHNLMALKV